MAYAFAVCVKFNNEKLFFNGFPFEKCILNIDGNGNVKSDHAILNIAFLI